MAPRAWQLESRSLSSAWSARNLAVIGECCFAWGPSVASSVGRSPFPVPRTILERYFDDI
jgi:hypothetical protein